MGLDKQTICNLESGKTTKPTIETIFKIKDIERMYADILKEYKKSPIRLSRLPRRDQKLYKGFAVYLHPIEIRRPEDIETLGRVETDSSTLFFGKKSRRIHQQIGISKKHKSKLARMSRAATWMHAKKAAERRSEHVDNKEEESGSPTDAKE